MLIVILVVVLVVVLAGRGDNDDDSKSSSSNRGSNTAAGDRILRMRAGAGNASACEPGTVEKSPGERASLDCKPVIPPGGTAASIPEGVSFYLFGSPDSMNAAYQTILENNQIVPDSGGLCTDGVAAEALYSHDDEAEAGHVVCFVDEEGDAVLWWTEGGSGRALDSPILGVAHLEGGDIARLSEWWFDNLD